MKLCLFCEWLLAKRRWYLLIPSCVLAAALLVLLPGFAAVPLSAPILMTSALLPLYALGRKRAFGPAFSRMPHPRDTLAQTVLLDASLLDRGTCLKAASQPFEVVTELSLQMGSSALVLGTAMTVLADKMPLADASAVLQAVTRLNIRPERMRARSIVLKQDTDGDVTRVTVQDGSRMRTYLLGTPEAVSHVCGAVWDGKIRPLTPEDTARISDTAAYIRQGNCRVYAWATAAGDEAPVFLGMAGIGDQLRLDALEQAAQLRAMGLTLTLRQPEDAMVDMAALHDAMNLPPVSAAPELYLSQGRIHEDPACLTICMDPNIPLTQPLEQLHRHFRHMSLTLRRLAWLLGVCLLGCSLAGSALAATVSTILLGAAAGFSPAGRASLPGWIASACAGALCLASRVIAGIAMPAFAPGAAALSCLLMAAVTVSGEAKPLWLRIVACLPALGVLAALIVTGGWLPAAFAAACGAAAGMLLILQR